MKRIVTGTLLASALLGGCDSLQGPLPADSAIMQIVDGAHGGGIDGFFFLPPMVGDPGVVGGVDPSLLPDLSVEICEWTGAACVQPLVRRFTNIAGDGSELLRLGDDQEHFIVNWHTRSDELDASRMYRIVVKWREHTIGFADVDVVESGKELRNVDTDQFIPLKDGRTLPIKFLAIGPFGPTTPPIVYMSNAYGGDLDLALINPDGSNPMQLTDLPGTETEPRWSPDGSLIAFRYATPSDQGNIYVVSEDGGLVIQLTAAAGADRNPTWMPGGDEILFSRDYRMYIMNADGTNQRPFPGTGAKEGTPSVSPDGGAIAFVSAASGQNQIYLMDIDGSNIRRLTFTPVDFNSVPRWSPDGLTLFCAGEPGANPALLDLYRIDAVTGLVTPLLDFSRQDANPIPSPDGSRVLFSGDPNGLSNLFMLDLATDSVTPVTPPSEFAGSPEWRSF